MISNESLLMSEKADQSLNDVLVDVHMDMQLLPFA